LIFFTDVLGFDVLVVLFFILFYFIFSVCFWKFSICLFVEKMEGKWGEYFVFVFVFLFLALVLIIVCGENFSTFVKKSNKEHWVIEDFGFVRAIERCCMSFPL